MLETVDLCQRHGERDVLKNINLKVDRGEVLALIGPTGAGKTTLLRLLNLLDTPVSGRIYFDGVDTTKSEMKRLEIRRRMGFILQKPVVFNMSVYDNIVCGLKWRGKDKNSTREKVSSILNTVDLSEYKDRNARTLSGGEAQRVAIARALVTEPEVLLLDEPTANLDPVSTSKIERVIENIIQQRNTTVIMATHDMSQGQLLADRIAVLVNGEVLQTGSARDIFIYPINRDVAEFVGIENIMDGAIVSNEDKIATIDVKSRLIEAISDFAAGEKVSVCLRPEDVTISLFKISSSARNSFHGEITRATTVGPVTRVEVDCGFPLIALVTRRSAEELQLEKGKQVYTTFKVTSIHVLKRQIR